MLAIEMSFRTIADIVSVAVLVGATLTIPYMAAALLFWRSSAKIRNTYRSKDAYYHPSLWFLTWITRADLFGIVFILGVLAIRVYARYESVSDVTPQPYWSLALSAVSSIVLLAILTLPATFLFAAKYWILTDPDLDRRGKILDRAGRRDSGLG